VAATERARPKHLADTRLVNFERIRGFSY
jgi:hypothetical protein